MLTAVGNQVWIHDYHLLLVPKMLRELLPSASPYISLFLHCPFPSSEYFRCLPRTLLNSAQHQHPHR